MHMCEGLAELKLSDLTYELLRRMAALVKDATDLLYSNVTKWLPSFGWMIKADAICT